MRRSEPDPQVWLDGQTVPLAEARISVEDPGVQHGAGLFETVALEHGRPLDLERHLERLTRGAARLGLALDDPASLARACRERASTQPAARGWLKLVVTRGGRRWVLTGTSDPESVGQPASAVLLRWRRNLADPLAGLKSLCYAGNRLGLEEAARRGADEGVWLNTRGHVAEGCTTNVFVVERTKLFTPAPRDGILPGIVRGRVLEVARERGLILHEGKLRLQRLERAREAFLTSSLGEVRPLVRYEGRPVGNGQPGSVTRALAAEVRKRRAATARGDGACGSRV